MGLIRSLILLSLFLVSCSGGSGSAVTECSFSLTGDHSGTYGGAVIKVESGFINFICGTLNGNSITAPQMNVIIHETHFVGAGIYDLKEGTNRLVRFTPDSSQIYESNSSSTNCTATFSSENSFTVACGNLAEDGGSGSVNITGGNWTFVE